MLTKLNLSELSGVMLMEVDVFSGKRLLEHLLEHPIASLYSNLDFLDNDKLELLDFLVWQRDFSSFMQENGIVVLVG